MRTRGSGSAAAVALAVLLTATGACRDVGPLEVQGIGADIGTPAAASQGADVERPLAETSSGVLSFTGNCTAGVVVEAQGTGTSTHIGRFEVALTWCLNTSTGAISDAAATVTSANGDRVQLTGAGQAVSSDELAFAFDIVGGTGRFTGASGQLDISAILGAAGTWTSSGTGWMSY